MRDGVSIVLECASGVLNVVLVGTGDFYDGEALATPWNPKLGLSRTDEVMLGGRSIAPLF